MEYQIPLWDINLLKTWDYRVTMRVLGRVDESIICHYVVAQVTIPDG